MRRFNRTFRALAVLFALTAIPFFASSFFSRPALAQNTASISGTLTDPSDAAVPGAAIVLQDIASPANTWKTVSGDDGRFQFDVPAGRYRLTITHPSLRRVEQELSIAPGERRDLQSYLELEPLSENVVVSAEARPINTESATGPVTIVTRDEIDRRQISELAPLLATLPGFSLGRADSAGGTTSMFLDGGNSNFTKVLVDGVTQNIPGGSIDFSNFTLDNIDKVEVVRGAQSALSGSDAMTGVVELLTHRGSTRLPLLTLESWGGSFSTGRGMAQLSGVMGRFDYSAAGSYFSTAGQGVNNRFVNRTLSGNFGWRLAENNSVRVTVRNNTSDAGAPGQTLFQPPNLDQHNALHVFSSGLTWQFSTGAHWQHQVTGSETYVRQLFSNPLSDFYTSPDPFGGCNLPRSSQAVASIYCDFPYLSRSQYNRAGFSAQSSYVSGRFVATAGYAYEVENGFLGALGGGHARRNNQAGFLDGRWQPTSRLVVNAGFRVEDNASFGTRGVPRAGATFTLRNGRDFWGATRLRVSYGQGIKEPRLDQSFGTDLCNPGNAGLRPEQSRTVHAGVEQRLAHDRLRITADYFENRFRDITSFTFCFPGGPCPVSPPAGCPFGFGTYFNTDLARARGATMSVEAQPARWLHIAANYTYDDTKVLAAPNAFDPAQAPGNRLIRRPLHAGNLVFSGGFGRFDGSLTTRVVGRRTDSDFLFPPLGLTQNPGYATMDIAGSFRLVRSITLIGHVDNLLDRHYQDVLGYPALGRGGYLGMRFRIGGE